MRCGGIVVKALKPVFTCCEKNSVKKNTILHEEIKKQIIPGLEDGATLAEQETASFLHAAPHGVPAACTKESNNTHM